jgi:hypothetical protein
VHGQQLHIISPRYHLLSKQKEKAPSSAIPLNVEKDAIHSKILNLSVSICIGRLRQ